MVALFAFEFIEGNSVTRLYFMKLRRLTREAIKAGHISLELEKARAEIMPTFTHFLDLPMFLVLISLGAMKTTTWTHFIIGTTVAILVATILTIVLPRIYSWDVQ